MLKLILYFYIRWNITTFFFTISIRQKMSIMSWKNTTGKETDKNNYRGRMHVAVVKSWLWHPQGCRFESWFHECVSNKSKFHSFIAAQVAFLVNLLRESKGCTRAKNIVHQVPDPPKPRIILYYLINDRIQVLPPDREPRQRSGQSRN